MLEISVGQALDNAFLRYASKVALDVDGREYTYEQIRDIANRLANGFLKLGLKKGDRLIIMTTNRAEYLFTDIAAAKCGLIKVPLNVMLSNRDIEYRLKDSRAKAVVMDTFFLKKTVLFFKEYDFINHVILIDPGVSRTSEGVLHFDEVISGSPADPPEIEVLPEDLMAIMYTGGTTGTPKGVMHTHKSCLSIFFSEMVELDINEGEVALICSPLPHATGFFIPPVLFRGGKVVVTEGFKPEVFFRLVEDKRISWTFMVPTMIYTLLDHPDLGRYDLGSLRTVLYGAAPILVSRLEDAYRKMGPIFLQGYSQMEVSCQTTKFSREDQQAAIDRNDKKRLQSCGQPILMAQVKVVDKDGRDVGVGQVGELITRGPHMMAGYWEKPEETQKTIVDGWIHTGDLAEIDEEGFIYLVDRKHDMIITGGLNVYSTEVENEIAGHPAVGEVVVFGAPDEKWGEQVRAIVVLRKGQTTDEQDLIAFCKERLSSYKVPKIIELRASIPKTAYGKFDKKKIRAEFWADRGRNI